MCTFPTCACNHEWAAHEYYRAGDECSLCECPSYRRPRRTPWQVWREVIGLVRR